MSVQDKIRKATLLLDLKGDVPRAEALLRKAVAEAHSHGDYVGWVQAGVFLGELLVELERDGEAFELLRQVVDSPVPAMVEPDLVASELRRARELLTHFEEDSDPGVA